MAYAAVTSLMGTLYLHFLQSQPRFPLEDKQQMMVSLHENLGFLQQVLEESEIPYDNSAMKELEAEMRQVLLEAEESIEIELSSIYLAKPANGWTKHLRRIFYETVKQTDYLMMKLITITSEYHLVKVSSQNDATITYVSTSSRPADLQGKNITVRKFSKKSTKFDNRMVGCDQEFMTILGQLTRQSSKQLQVVSIVGMGGIGKTTLAQKIYEDPPITSHFDKRAWVTVSQEYNMEQMLRCLIGCVSAPRDVRDEQRKPKDSLPEILRKHLKGQRYLIVVDDIWSTRAWDCVQRCFSDDNNGSRVLLTSRLKEVAEYASSGNSPLNMPLLNPVESWNLYCKVFDRTEFGFEFERIGRHIVNKCEGLPLAIIVVASLLSKTEEAVEKWNNVAENVIGDSNETCSRILYLSYKQLPHHLKACFLYFGVFPEDYEISVKKLVTLWAAEGFLRSVNHRNPEEVGMECLQDLVDRSLVLVSKESYNGKIKTIRIHDLLRDLCLREARRENLLNVVIEKLPFYKRISEHLFSKPCHWISIRGGSFNDQIKSKCFDKLHSLHCYDDIHVGIKVFSHFKLLRVVDLEIRIIGDCKALNALANLVHLRYLALFASAARIFHVALFEHWNIQSFILRCYGGILDSSEASGIWKMPMLRNFHNDIRFSLETSEVVHRNLETLSWLDSKCCTNDLFTRIPNLKKLGIQGGASSENPDYFYNFVQLGQLEKLSIKGWHPKGISCSGIPWATSFLPNLKKLNFKGTGLPWSDMRLIGMLPNLEVLKLINACEGPKWEPSKGGFPLLKKLVIEETFVNWYWDARGDHFPMLECLEFRKCYSLQEIPSGFADITTLALIQLNECRDSLLASAKWIQDEQNSYGNDALLVLSENIKRGDEPVILTSQTPTEYASSSMMEPDVG